VDHRVAENKNPTPGLGGRGKRRNKRRREGGHVDSFLNPQPSTPKPQPSTPKLQPYTLNPYPETSNPELLALAEVSGESSAAGFEGMSLGGRDET